MSERKNKGNAKRLCCCLIINTDQHETNTTFSMGNAGNAVRKSRGESALEQRVLVSGSRDGGSAKSSAMKASKGSKMGDDNDVVSYNGLGKVRRNLCLFAT